MPADELIGDSVGNELASNRTEMAFMRSELAAERTLMAGVRTALSLISFGFTINSVMRGMRKNMPGADIPVDAPARFAMSLIGLGLLVLILGLISHWQATHSLRLRGRRLFAMKLVHEAPPVHRSSTAFIAIILFIVGVMSMFSIAFRVGPF